MHLYSTRLRNAQDNDDNEDAFCRPRGELLLVMVQRQAQTDSLSTPIAGTNVPPNQRHAQNI